MKMPEIWTNTNTTQIFVAHGKPHKEASEYAFSRQINLNYKEQELTLKCLGVKLKEVLK